MSAARCWSWSTLAFALDWQRPTRHMTGTSFFYLHTDQWRYESFGAAELASPAGNAGTATASWDGLWPPA